jgi:hypothetical protein
MTKAQAQERNEAIAQLRFTPRIRVSIPLDVDSSKRPQINATIDRLNRQLAHSAYDYRDQAIEQAAVALSNSDVGACGIPDAMRS